MQVRKFVFKFVNHDAQHIKVIKVFVHCNRVIEWTHHPDDVEAHIQWLTRHVRWEHQLKKEVKKLVLKKHFGTDEIHNDYHFCKESFKKEGEKINVSPVGSTEIRLRQVKLLEECVFKFDKGTKPADWKEIFDYGKTVEIHNFHLSGDDTTGEIKLTHLGQTFEVPSEGGIFASKSTKGTYNIPSNVTTNQTLSNLANRLASASKTGTQPTVQQGGDIYEDRYMKYKKKYLDLKNSKRMY